jgi:hypothetical protein
MTTVAMGVFLLLAPILAAQQRPTLEAILDDASYVFNRYDELTTGVICDSWKVDDSLKRTCKRELRAIASNVEDTKVILRRASKSGNPELVDLLDIYSELNEVGGHLDELSNNLGSFTSVSGVPYSEAAAKESSMNDAKRDDEDDMVVTSCRTVSFSNSLSSLHSYGVDLSRTLSL